MRYQTYNLFLKKERIEAGIFQNLEGKGQRGWKVKFPRI
jgi:hypothetical protein